MPGFSDIDTLTTPGGVLTFNAATGNTFHIDPARSAGLGSGEIRAAIDDQGQQSGYILHPEWFEKGSQFLLGGVISVDTVANRNSMQAEMKSKLRTILSANGTLHFTTGESVTVRWNMGCDFPHISGPLKGFVFGVVSATPW